MTDGLHVLLWPAFSQNKEKTVFLWCTGSEQTLGLVVRVILHLNTIILVLAANTKLSVAEKH